MRRLFHRKSVIADLAEHNTKLRKQIQMLQEENEQLRSEKEQDKKMRDWLRSDGDRLHSKNTELETKNSILLHKIKFYSDAIDKIRAELRDEDYRGAFLLMLWLMEKTEKWGKGDKNVHS
ncbi:hypothetical protein MOC74_05995 [Bacillus haynesii]|uniref:hypothetical protein n=1 Tax=Bacillus haynesii TaxID=1925021 RepID=UPI00227DD52B|nr:hypothetical protein [Bacillus haynesii]MCY8345021.1 hypothetical protein [Bacillus haynesii]